MPNSSLDTWSRTDGTEADKDSNLGADARLIGFGVCKQVTSFMEPRRCPSIMHEFYIIEEV